MRKKHEFTLAEEELIHASFEAVWEMTRTITDGKRHAKVIRAVAERLNATYRKSRVTPDQMSFEDKLVMEDTMRGPDFPDEEVAGGTS